MRKGLGAIVALLVALASTASSAAHPMGPTASCAKAGLNLVNAGTLTIGTDNPAYPPWYGGGTPKGSKWQLNDPSTGKGFEPAVAYAVAAKLGFAKSDVKWIYV